MSVNVVGTEGRNGDCPGRATVYSQGWSRGATPGTPAHPQEEFVAFLQQHQMAYDEQYLWE